MKSFRRVSLQVLAVAIAWTPLLAQPWGSAREAVEAGRRAARRDGAIPTAGAGTSEVARRTALMAATMARHRYQYRVSDALYRRLLGRGQPVDGVTGYAALGHAAAFAVRWVPDSATSWLRVAVREGARLGDASLEGEALATLAPMMGRRGFADSARVMMARAGELLPAGAPGSAQRLCGLGLQLRLSSVRAADSVVRAGLAAARSDGDSSAVARCLLSAAVVLEARGLQRQVAATLDTVLAYAAALRDYDLLGNAEQWHAYSNATYGTNLGAGRRYAERAISRTAITGNPITAAWARLNLAQVALRVGDAALAFRASEESRREFRRLGDASAEVSVLGVQGRASVLAGRLEDGIARYARAESLLVAARQVSATPALTLWRALALLDLGRLAAASAALDSALATARRHGLGGIVNGSAPYVQGRLHLRRGEYEEAIAAFQRFKTATTSRAYHDQLDADLRIAEAYARSGQLAAAESVFTLGNASLGRMRAVERDRGDILRLLSGQRYDPDPDLGIATIVNRLATGGRLEGAFAIAESERARWLWTRRARRGAMAAAAREVGTIDDVPVGLGDVRQALDGTTGIVSFVTGRGGEPTTAFVAWRGGARAVTLAPVDTLARDIAWFATLLSSGRETRALARTLGRRLMDPVLATLPPEVTNLRIVPDGQLWHVPFDALLTAGGRALVERYVVSFVPSVRLAIAPVASGGGRRVLAFGDPVFDSRHGLPRLPASADEARAVVRAARGAGQVLVRDEARVEALVRADLRDVGVVHLATHARVQDHGLLENAVFLSRDDEGDGRLGSEDIVAIPLPVDLVVLSACRTVGGFVATGEGVQGLVGPVLEAGAHSVAVTYWDVPDRSLQPLMERFYGAMAGGATVAGALASAKRQMIGRGAPARVWAAVGLVGDGRVRPLTAEEAPPEAPAPGSPGSFRRRSARSPTM